MAEIRGEVGRGLATDGGSRIYSGGGLLTSPGPLRAVVAFVAGIPVGVYTKLLTGFLVGALLLLGMGILSLVVIARMSQRVDDLTRLQEKVDRARQMEYAVTAQSHFRAMALLTGDDTNNVKIAKAKEGFGGNLTAVESISFPERDAFFGQVRETNGMFAASSERTLGLYDAGNMDEALSLHLAEEHPLSHELEGAMRELVRGSTRQTAEANDAFNSDRGFLAAMVGAFSGVSLVVALLLGFVLSWLVIGARCIGWDRRCAKWAQEISPISLRWRIATSWAS